jgi:hypothetical protein
MVNSSDPGRILHALHHDAELSISIAQGILVERYQLGSDLALSLLAQRAELAGIPLVEAARWLMTAGNLP